MSVFIAVDPSFYAGLPAKFLRVWDTYATDGVWPSTKVTYGEDDWPSSCHWVVYFEDID